MRLAGFLAGYARIAFAVLALICVSDAALAHATLVAAEPRDGAVVEEAPSVLHLQFNEEVAPSSVKLIDAGGRERSDVSLHTQGKTVILTLPRDLPKGTQTVSYRVISADGHPVTGATIFSIGYLTGATQISTSPHRDAAIWLARLALYLGLFGGVGGVFFARWVARRDEKQRNVMPLLAAGVVGAIASLGLQGLELLDLAPSALLSGAPWRAGWETSLGPSLAIAVVSLALAALAAKLQGIIARVCVGLALIGVGCALAASGHAASAPPQMVMRSVVFVHGVAVAYWIGALLPLIVLIQRPGRAAIAILDRFAAGAAVALIALLTTGITLAVTQLDRPLAILETGYGRLLAAKLALVAGLLALAAYNRLYLTPRLSRSGQTITTAKKLGRSILVESVVVIAVLGVVAAWRFTPPPRVLAQATQAPLSMHLHTEKGMVQITITPGRVGANTINMQFMNEDFTTQKVMEAKVELTLPERNIEGLASQSAPEQPDGTREVGVVIPQPGRWKLSVDALIDDFRQFRADGEFEMPGR